MNRFLDVTADAFSELLWTFKIYSITDPPVWFPDLGGVVGRLVWFGLVAGGAWLAWSIMSTTTVDELAWILTGLLMLLHSVVR